MAAVKCVFDIMSFLLEDENGCYVTPVDKPNKIMAQFSSSYEMIYFLTKKDFVYNKETYEFVKNTRRYILWIF
jgi:hypothetical protein